MDTIRIGELPEVPRDLIRTIRMIDRGYLHFCRTHCLDPKTGEWERNDKFFPHEQARRGKRGRKGGA